MNITYNSTIYSLIKCVRNEVNRWRDGDDRFLCHMFSSILTELLEKYIENSKAEIELDSIFIYFYVRKNLDKFIPEFNRTYAEELGFITKYYSVWFNNNEERIKFLDNLMNIYKDKRITIKTLIEQFIKNYEKRN